MPATGGKPFTHILKPAGTGGFETLPIIEWMSLSLGREAGFEAPNFALVPMPDDMMPALVVERFDIRITPEDERLVALEDFCSLLDLTASDKYRGTIERAGRALRALSTRPDDDTQTLLRRGLFAWLVADGDMHLKNLAVLKTALPGERMFLSVRMAPLYDAVTTVVFPGLQNDRMAMKLNGKDDNLKSADFHRAAATLGIKASDAEEMIMRTVERMRKAVDIVALPEGLGRERRIDELIGRMLDTCRKRLAQFI